MSEVKRYFIMESAVAVMLEEQMTYTPLVNQKTGVHVVPLVMGTDYAALETERDELRQQLDSFQRAGMRAMEERDAAMAECERLRVMLAHKVEHHCDLNRAADGTCFKCGSTLGAKP